MDRSEHQDQKKGTNLLIIMGGLWLLLAIALFYFQLVQPASIKIDWTTETELETAGFNLYRGQSPDDEFTLINDKLIPSDGSAVTGASYSYIDKEIAPGETYYYILEEVEYDATTNRYEEEMFQHSVPPITWWVLLITAVSVVVGLSLIFIGVRDSKQ